MLSAAEREGLARELRRAAGIAPGDIVRAEQIAEPLVGPVIRFRLRGAEAMLVEVHGSPRIVVRPGVDDENFCVAHELGHYALRHLAGLRPTFDEEERQANMLAAAILAPAFPLRQARQHFGTCARALASIAVLFGMSQTATVLRFAEADDENRAVVTRSGYVMMRGRSETPWASDDQARSWARARAPRGLVKVRLRGGIDDGRVALSAG